MMVSDHPGIIKVWICVGIALVVVFVQVSGGDSCRNIGDMLCYSMGSL